MMVLKQRYRWGYRTLVAEVSDSIHLRRFCRISLSERVPDESTIRKLTRRFGFETVAELTRGLIVKVCREKRFRPRAVRIDSTVIEADVKYPTDAGLALSGVKVLAREGRKLAALLKEKKARVGDRSRAMGRKLRAITRTIRRRSGEAKQEVLTLTERTGELLTKSVKEARRLAKVARSTARGRGAKAKLKGGGGVGGDGRSLREGRPADPPAGGGGADQGQDRVVVRPGRQADPQGEAGETERIWIRKPVGGGDGEHQEGCARVDPARVDRVGNPAEDTLLAGTVEELNQLGINVQEVALDGGFNVTPTNSALEDLAPKTVFIAGRREPSSKRTARRLRRYRTVRRAGSVTSNAATAWIDPA